jgi:hypothetical protein
MMPTLPQNARLAGYLGLIPFAALAAATVVASPAQSEQAARALVAYAAIIATFVGAIHWGLAAGRQERPPNWQYLWSVAPSLIAWPCLFLPSRAALLVIAILLSVCLLVDARATHAGAFPANMMKLRYRLTGIAVTGLIVAATFTKHIY